MTKRIHGHGGFAIPINPIITEGPLPRDPLNVRIMRKEIHRLETRLRQEEGEIAALRQMLISHAAEEHWEVPG